MELKNTLTLQKYISREFISLDITRIAPTSVGVQRIRDTSHIIRTKWKSCLTFAHEVLRWNHARRSILSNVRSDRWEYIAWNPSWCRHPQIHRYPDRLRQGFVVPHFRSVLRTAVWVCYGDYRRYSLCTSARSACLPSPLHLFPRASGCRCFLRPRAFYGWPSKCSRSSQWG